MITSMIGKDATQAFNGGIYRHSNAAANILSTMRVGIVRGGMEVEIWKRYHKHEGPHVVKDSQGNPIVRAGEQHGVIPQLSAAADAA